MTTSTPILGLLGVSFVVLKLMGYITWSWWLVTAPFWGGFAVVAVFLVVWLFVAATGKMLAR
jgi:hypothetical protein